MKRKIPVAFNCNVNEVKTRLEGFVELEDGSGYCKAEVEFDRSELPRGFEPEILSYVSITGYPAACRSSGNAVNLFSDSKAEFKTNRKLDLGAFGSLNTIYFSENRGTKDERITFNVSGTIAIPEKIVDIAPTSEVWLPSRIPGQFSGEMNFAWSLNNQTRLVGHAESRYLLNTELTLNRKQMRVITFDLERYEDHFVQNETIILYDLEEWNRSIYQQAARSAA